MRGKAKDWGVPTTLTIAYKPSKREWYASFTVPVEVPKPEFGSPSDLRYESIVAYDLGTEYAGGEFDEVSNPRFPQKSEAKIRQTAKLKRRQRPPKQGVKASRRWKKVNRRESQLKSKVARQRRDWQHKVTMAYATYGTEIARRYDKGLRPADANGVTEQLNTQG